MDGSKAIIGDRFREALDALVKAFNYAEDSQTDRWQFAIGIAELEASGATLADLRWLVLRGFAEHGWETTIPGDTERSFRKLPPTAFPGGAHFVLSRAGAYAIRQLLPIDGPKAARDTSEATAKPTDTLGPKTELPPIPEWDGAHRELRFRGQIVKRYRVPAQNQAMILTAFQESGWPDCIDDPLPQRAGRDPKERLQATIKSLNRNQHTPLIRFHGNGNGQQVYWQDAAPAGDRRRRRAR